MNQAHELLKGKIWELVVWRALGKPPTEACGWSQHLTPGLRVLELTSMLQSQCSQPKSSPHTCPALIGLTSSKNRSI